jgi:hypothetical protein
LVVEVEVVVTQTEQEVLEVLEVEVEVIQADREVQVHQVKEIMVVLEQIIKQVVAAAVLEAKVFQLVQAPVVLVVQAVQEYHHQSQDHL